jgi:hypothetical protein
MEDDFLGKGELVQKVYERASKATFGSPLITNINRGLIAETIVALALEPEWLWVSADYSNWDFERADGVKLEVKQSALLQSWTIEYQGKDFRSKASFDIAARTGYRQGQNWVAKAGRAAHIYVFCHHVVGDETADHRDPSQWDFYIVEANKLPLQKKISLNPLKSLFDPVCFKDVLAKVNSVAEAVSAFEYEF